MTTPEAAARYEAQHVAEHAHRKPVVYNPHDRPIEELPVIYGFNNGGSPDWLEALAIAEDGEVLGGHICSSEAYMPHDLGLIEGARDDLHEKYYRPHYPAGYRMEFVSNSKVDSHEKLMAAIKIAEKRTPTSY